MLSFYGDFRNKAASRLPEKITYSHITFATPPSECSN